ncbi:hypothetical protein RYJ27_05990 [Microbacterium limosum]|uniref:Uncharacterized protein n=1 Tax=Microbacterium limosum TaxID=3079935 RepID=A0AAU0MKE6_9MICO|nr:hypothetical protein [Microbacterium sp. Y20]WOQ70739.1 hypothetical protein RYJ27_05990 [Microbacterium sp. Y20]
MDVVEKLRRVQEQGTVAVARPGGGLVDAVIQFGQAASAGRATRVDLVGDVVGERLSVHGTEAVHDGVHGGGLILLNLEVQFHLFRSP